jgi:hypothetical protein
MKLKFKNIDDEIKLSRKVKFSEDSTWMEVIDAFQELLDEVGGFDYLSKEYIGKSFSEILMKEIHKEK